MSHFTIPEAFARGIRGESGTDGDEWLERLPKLVEETLTGWDLTPTGDVMHGYLAIVVTAHDADATYAVKFTRPGPRADEEAAALSAWSGNGAARLFKSRLEAGALLLERLDARRTLSVLPIEEAIDVAGSLLRRLAVAPPQGIESLEERVRSWIEQWTRAFEDCGRPFPRRLLDAAIDLSRQLAPLADRLLVDEDLHYDNVLAGTREPWSVIDPKVVVGDVEYGIAPLFWNRSEENRFDERLDGIVQAAGLRPGHARSWLLVRTIDLWLWAIPLGFTEYAGTCATLIEWLDSLS